jgi:hypothetical protein
LADGGEVEDGEGYHDGLFCVWTGSPRGAPSLILASHPVRLRGLFSDFTIL